MLIQITVFCLPFLAQKKEYSLATFLFGLVNYKQPSRTFFVRCVRTLQRVNRGEIVRVQMSNYRQAQSQESPSVPYFRSCSFLQSLHREATCRELHSSISCSC